MTTPLKISTGLIEASDYRTEKREAGCAPAAGSAVFGSVFGKIETMTALQEKVVRLGFCPNCSPQEGRAEQMRLLGDFGPMRAWQCGRCTNVWVTSPPNVEACEPPTRGVDCNDSGNGGSQR